MNANFPVPQTLKPNLWPTSNLYSLSHPTLPSKKIFQPIQPSPLFPIGSSSSEKPSFPSTGTILFESVMLAVSPLSTTKTTSAKDGCRDQADMDFHSSGDPAVPPSFSDVDFPDFDSIDFDDLFGGDALPYLEMEPEDLLADFAICPSSADEESSVASVDYAANQVVPNCMIEDQCKVPAIETGKDDEIESKKSSKEGEHKTKKNSKSNCSNEGKRKTKVDWTPDLHRRFVQAVEQLGVDKAVPSRILELMGIDCLTRHNVASHLQKYRSHRKHLLAREAEAANWTQKRQMYGIAVAPPPPTGGGGTNKGGANHPWHAPTMGFPPPTPPPIHHPYRPLHVWGHPTHHHVDHQSPPMPIWPKQLIPPLSPLPPPPHPWVAPPPAEPSLWHSRHQRVPNAVTPITPYFPPPLAAARFAVAPPVPGIPPPAMYRPDQHGVGAPAVTLQPGPGHPDPLDSHPTKESIDAAIGDVLTKPWLPLPIGLKPPSTDSVMGELQRQGVPAIPPSCA